ncbi:PEP-CTERM motif protein [Posidoniimonas polymericola]|uniref:PEP-CTERM motif protein n=1 Tax=Posidoniimonas polymericola TaxID=2528002 RepID=A0A5C5YQC3_9BACT|nr:PEP-CTERM sorting domain-containing protein [Posidoniimonas polymericola]TWT77115.1 PEP-CTERM motif protein [Posidoniimonas polymericola]
MTSPQQDAQQRPLPTSQVAKRVAYSAAAGAAALAATTADAQISYSGVQDLAIGQFSSQSLNIDGDAYNDILLKNYVFGGGNYQGATVAYAPGQLVGFTTGLTYATALSAGDPIDGSTVGPSFFGGLAYGAVNPDAQFNNATDAYIGLSFPSGPDTYYGWIRVTIDNAAGTFVVNDWAYNTVSGAGIAAGQTPEPGTLGLLAAGAAGLAAARRRRQDAA